MKKVLLHICCGVCALHSLDKLKKDLFVPYGFFYNPNIYPADEQAKRRDAACKACSIFGVEFFAGENNYAYWRKVCEPYQAEPEGGLRCLKCYELRLKVAFDFAVKNGFDYLTSTLTISPHKNSKQIFELAHAVCGAKYLCIDFKKEDGFKKTMELAREHNLYRQNYCGCEYSLR